MTISALGDAETGLRAQVLTLPNLEPLMATHLTPVLGFPFTWAADGADAAKLHRTLSLSLSGVLTLVAAPSVLLRVALHGELLRHLSTLPGDPATEWPVLHLGSGWGRCSQAAQEAIPVPVRRAHPGGCAQRAPQTGPSQ